MVSTLIFLYCLCIYCHIQFTYFADEIQIRKIVLWLEANKIKKCSSNNASFFKNINSQDWPKHFDSYKRQVGCPSFANRLEEVEWLLGYVIQQEYSSKSNFLQLKTCYSLMVLLFSENVYKQHAVENIKSLNVPSVVAENPLDKLDCK